MRPVLKIPPLHEDAAAVMTTMLMMLAAPGMPILSNIMTNGLMSGFELIPRHQRHDDHERADIEKQNAEDDAVGGARQH